MSIMPVDTEELGVKYMPIALAIISAIMAARDMKNSDDKLTGAFNVLGSAYKGYQTGSMFQTQKPVFNNTLGDFGARRNYL